MPHIPPPPPPPPSPSHLCRSACACRRFPTTHFSWTTTATPSLPSSREGCLCRSPQTTRCRRGWGGGWQGPRGAAAVGRQAGGAPALPAAASTWRRGPPAFCAAACGNHMLGAPPPCRSTSPRSPWWRSTRWRRRRAAHLPVSDCCWMMMMMMLMIVLCAAGPAAGPATDACTPRAAAACPSHRRCGSCLPPTCVRWRATRCCTQASLTRQAACRLCHPLGRRTCLVLLQRRCIGQPLQSPLHSALHHFPCCVHATGARGGPTEETKRRHSRTARTDSLSPFRLAFEPPPAAALLLSCCRSRCTGCTPTTGSWAPRATTSKKQTCRRCACASGGWTGGGEQA